MFRFILAAAIAVHSGIAAAELVSLEIAEDTFISEHPGLGGISANHGEARDLYVVNPAGYQSFALLRFDTSMISRRSVVESASLSLTSRGLSFSDSMSFTVYALSNSWSEVGSTWENFKPNLGSPLAAGLLSNPLSGYELTLELDVAVLQEWIISPDKNFGLIIKADSGRDWKVASSENSDLNGPSLNVAYSISPIPEPSTMYMFGFGILGAVLCLRRRLLGTI